MSAKKDAVNWLQSASTTCDAALKALKDPDSTVSAPEGQNIEAVTLKTLLSDFTSLLNLLYQSTTKLSIALKPSSPTYAAALTPLKDLRANIDALASCTCSIEASKFGGAMSREARWIAEDVINALRQLFAVFLDAASRSGTNAKTYLARTGAVHEAIDRARGISQSNREAVRKRWTSDMDSLKDCVTEVVELTMEGDGTDDGDGEDGWDDLEIDGLSDGDTPKATEDELKRLNSAHNLFKSLLSLFKSISSQLLLDTGKVEVKSPTQLDSLLVSSGALVVASDELVSTLDVPHDIQAVSDACVIVMKHVSDLQTFLATHGVATTPTIKKPKADDLANRTASLTMDNSPGSDHSSEVAKLPLDEYFADISRWAEVLQVSDGS
ncbi:hypothetical protein SCHPADRAFT_935888 [Schizopora paradoxa]|uniref:Cyclin-D1-binding protein 1-like N-terminal domain-containing protein n=1 Tax=Schizopora paradoxa TaxID=27342 RepID=A0A0H2S416_9AGAM|nr:hypothetical protein SCHPADRAFT_935888 [Schizopora paradoxa]